MTNTPFPAIIIGVLIGVIFMGIAYIAVQCVGAFIEWARETYEKKKWLYKRNRHRKKCGLKPIKN